MPRPKKSKSSKAKTKPSNKARKSTKVSAEKRTTTLGIAFRPADLVDLDKGVKKHTLSRSSAVRVALRLWKASGYKLDKQAKEHEVRSHLIARKGEGAKALKEAAKAEAKKKARVSKARKKELEARAAQRVALQKKVAAMRATADNWKLQQAQAQRDRKNAKLREKRAAGKKSPPVVGILESYDSGAPSAQPADPSSVDA